MSCTRGVLGLVISHIRSRLSEPSVISKFALLVLSMQQMAPWCARAFAFEKAPLCFRDSFVVLQSNAHSEPLDDRTSHNRTLPLASPEDSRWSCPDTHFTNVTPLECLSPSWLQPPMPSV